MIQVMVSSDQKRVTAFVHFWAPFLYMPPSPNTLQHLERQSEYVSFLLSPWGNPPRAQDEQEWEAELMLSCSSTPAPYLLSPDVADTLLPVSASSRHSRKFSAWKENGTREAETLSPNTLEMSHRHSSLLAEQDPAQISPLCVCNSWICNII